jgi:hypothetical protein
MVGCQPQGTPDIQWARAADPLAATRNFRFDTDLLATFELHHPPVTDHQLD